MEEATKKNGWLFDWKLEFSRPQRQVYKLIAEKEPETMHDLLSLKKMEDHVFIHLIENAPINRGKGKKYLGVAGNLTAYGCKLSKKYGFDGIVVFEPKTALITQNKKTLGAVLISDRRMAIMEDRAMFLLDKYFPETQEEL
jgi:hypothetical protein